MKDITARGPLDGLSRLTRAIGVKLLAIACALSLAACQTTQLPRVFTPSAPPNLNEEQLAAYEEDFNRTIIEGILVGAAGGAAVGAVASAAADGEDLGLSILVGTLVGALAGGLGGYYVAKSKGEYANEYAFLDSMIADVRDHNTKLGAYIKTAAKVRAENEARLDRLRAKLGTGKTTRAEYDKHLSRVEQNHAAIEGALDSLRDRHEEYVLASGQVKQDYPNVSTTQFDGEIRTLERQIQALEEEYRALGEVIEVNRLG